MNQAFDAVLEIRFRQCPGHRKITKKEYTLLYTLPVIPKEYVLQYGSQIEVQGDIPRTDDFRRFLYPGQHVIMYMSFEFIDHDISVCPGCNLRPPKGENPWETQTEWYSYQALSLV